MSEWTDDLETYHAEQLFKRGGIWCRETAEPSAQKDWSEDRPMLGQGLVTALLVQDIVGGKLMHAAVEGFGSHYYVRLWHGPVDLTRDQFPEGTAIPEGEPVERAEVLESERAVAADTQRRYLLLKERYRAALDKAR